MRSILDLTALIANIFLLIKKLPCILGQIGHFSFVISSNIYKIMGFLACTEVSSFFFFFFVRINLRGLGSQYTATKEVPKEIERTISSSPEKAMAPHSSTFAWKIPWMEEPGRLRVGCLRVGLDWATSLSLFTLMHWRRKWQPTPVFLPGESQGLGSLVGFCLWGRTELDTTEAT